MPRVNVYVTDALKADMDAVGDRVNWSEAAQRAFEREVAAATMPEDPNFDQVLDRLRKSKADAWHLDVRRARELGREWAKKTASYSQLKRISALQLTGGRGQDYWRVFDEAAGTSCDDDAPYGRSYTDDGDEFAPHDSYIVAFVEGVKDVWALVADKI